MPRSDRVASNTRLIIGSDGAASNTMSMPVVNRPAFQTLAPDSGKDIVTLPPDSGEGIVVLPQDSDEDVTLSAQWRTSLCLYAQLKTLSSLLVRPGISLCLPGPLRMSSSCLSTPSRSSPCHKSENIILQVSFMENVSITQSYCRSALYLLLCLEQCLPQILGLR